MAFAATGLFGPFEEVQFEHEQLLGAEKLESRVGSTSAIAALAAEKREVVLERVRALAGHGRVRLRYRCEVYLTQRAGP